MNEAMTAIRQQIEKERETLERLGFNSARLVNEGGKDGRTFQSYVKNELPYDQLVSLFKWLDGFKTAVKYQGLYANQSQRGGF